VLAVVVVAAAKVVGTTDEALVDMLRVAVSPVLTQSLLKSSSTVCPMATSFEDESAAIRQSTHSSRFISFVCVHRQVAIEQVFSVSIIGVQIVWHCVGKVLGSSGAVRRRNELRSDSGKLEQ